MRLSFNALALRPGGSGVQTYIRELLAELRRLTTAEMRAAVQPDALGELPPGITPIARRRTDGVARVLEGLRDLGPTDVGHGLDVDLPVRRRAPFVTTVHDTAVFDVPDAFARVRTLGEQRIMRLNLRRADRIITMSRFTAERIPDLFGREATVIPLAPRSDIGPAPVEECQAVRTVLDLPERFVLHLGNIEPRKDVPTLAKACETAQLPLVLAGARVTDGIELPASARSLGYVPAAQLAALLGAATVVAYPSRYEGFGLPPIEAMACGAPVVATQVPALIETLGDAADLVSPGDVDALAGALRAVFDDDAHRRELVEAGRERAALFTWRRTAEKTLEVYRSLGLDLPLTEAP